MDREFFIISKHGQRSRVDKEDYDNLNSFIWKYGCGGYLYRTVFDEKTRKYNSVLMHRVIMRTPKGMLTDHINGDRLDNRKCNLRICNKAQNNMNQRKTRGLSIYKGVTWHKLRNKWRAYIKLDGKQKHLGLFYSEEEAAKAYNESAKILFGEFCLLNDV